MGDPEQLPPIVQNDYAKQMGMEESLFERLFDSECIEHLTLQYRMNKTINTLANKLTYNGKLMCGNTKVTESCLTFTEVYQIFLINYYFLMCANVTLADSNNLELFTQEKRTRRRFKISGSGY